MKVYINNNQSRIKISEKIIELLEKVVEESLIVEERDRDYEVSISFVDNEEIKRLNKNYRGVDQYTDVLSFPMEDDWIMPIDMLGDIIISVEKALEQAEDYGHSVQRELAYLTSHSMFHLMGYDHVSRGGKKIMREKEKLVMKNLEIFKENKGE